MMTNSPLEIRSILAKNLKEQRKKMGLSQEKFAEISGLSIQTINDIEGGRKWVSDKTMTKLSTTLNLECYQLLLPKLAIQRKKEINSTQQLWDLMKNLKKSIDSQVVSHFTEYLKGVRRH
jgi:transcriptional regulator with XRE-family HTH domain